MERPVLRLTLALMASPIHTGVPFTPFETKEGYRILRICIRGLGAPMRSERRKEEVGSSSGTSVAGSPTLPSPTVRIRFRCSLNTCSPAGRTVSQGSRLRARVWDDAPGSRYDGEGGKVFRPLSFLLGKKM